MLLSIGMIVKNEEKYLEECLTALKPILENVDSELIIADTGSTDRTVEIAKKFTDNVFHFEWINDFAAARNSTLDKAQGEWYMFLDADEIITDATELIEFFNSGEYKRYGSGTITIKNYNDLSQRDVFNTYNLHRLTALANGVRFEKPIHENFNQYFTPIKNLNVVADHYGYVIRDNGKILDTLEKKTSRNLDLLFQELEEGEKTGEVKETVYAQIADCYLMLGEIDEAMEYIDKGFEHCNPKSPVLFNYYLKKVKALSGQRKHKEVEEICIKYFSPENEARKGKLVTDCTFYFYWATAKFEFKDFDEVINKAVLGFDIYRSYRSGKLYTAELNFCGIEASIPMLKQICNMLIIACVKQERFNDAVNQLPNIPLEDFFSDTPFMKAHLNIRNMLMDKTNYNKLPDLYYFLDKPNREIYINILIRHIFKAEKKELFLKKLSIISADSERLADVVKIYKSYFIEHKLYPTQTTEFIKKHGAKNNEGIWILMMKNHFDITPFICADDFEPEESVDELYADVQQPQSAMEMFESSMYRLSQDGVEKAVEAFGKAVYSATAKRFNTSRVIRTFGMLGKRWTDLNPDKEPPETVVFALTLDEISNLHRRKHYDESIERINSLGYFNDQIAAPAENASEQPTQNDPRVLSE